MGSPLGGPLSRRSSAIIITLGIITRYYNKIICPLLNYLVTFIVKLYFWDCRRNRTFPNVKVFELKNQLKYETELYILHTSGNMKFLREKWLTFKTL